MSTSERTTPVAGGGADPAAPAVTGVPVEPGRPTEPPVYVSPPTKVRDDTVRPPLPGLAVDTVFFAVATLSAG